MVLKCVQCLITDIVKYLECYVTETVIKPNTAFEAHSLGLIHYKKNNLYLYLYFLLRDKYYFYFTTVKLGYNKLSVNEFPVITNIFPIFRSQIHV